MLTKWKVQWAKTKTLTTGERLTALYINGQDDWSIAAGLPERMSSSIISASPRYAAAWSGVRFSLSCEDITTQSGNFKHDHILFSHTHIIHGETLLLQTTANRRSEHQGDKHLQSLHSTTSAQPAASPSPLSPFQCSMQSAKWGYKQTSCDCKLLTPDRLGVMTPAILTHTH